MSTPLSFDETLDILAKLRPYYTPAEAMFWLTQPHPQLDGRKAVECSAAEVMAIIDRLEGSTYL